MSFMTLSNVQTIEVLVTSKKLHNLKILHLSDLHINKKTTLSQLKELINLCNNLNYDIAVITGDIIDTKVKFIKEKLHILNNLKGIVYFISGNHDLFYGLEDLKNELSNFILWIIVAKYLPIKMKLFILLDFLIDFQNFSK